MWIVKECTLLSFCMIKCIENDDGTIVSIGRTAKGNDLLWKSSEKHHIWLHLQNESSPHVVIHNNESHFEDKVLLKQAALFVKQYSKLRNEKKVKVIYCKIDNLYPTKTLGMVKLKNTPNCISV